MMSFWNVIIAILSAVYLSLMYGVGFSVGYTAVMNGHNLVGE